jgi:hypothetical protein
VTAVCPRVAAIDIYFTFAERVLCIIGGPVATLES